MNKERLMTVLIQPHVSEKAANVGEKANQYVFRVIDDASKAEVKQAVELMFEVKVEGVNLLNRPGKTRRFKNMAKSKRSPKSSAVMNLAPRRSAPSINAWMRNCTVLCIEAWRRSFLT